METNRIVTKPKVYLVGKQTLNEEAFARFLQDESCDFTTDTPVAAEKLAEAAGRVCYMSYGKGRKTNKEYLDRIIESKHGSVLEHAVWNFLFTGISRSLTHELIRHRAGVGISQLSQRYVDESDARYCMPPLIRDNPTLHEQWIKAIEASHQSYLELANSLEKVVAEKHPELSGTDRRKMVRQTARSVLPNACETKLFFTANARALRHIIELRGSIHADAEIRELAVEIAKIMRKESPNLFADVNIVKEKGEEVVSITYSKV
ncbi:MAG: thymidylate synthase, flavin-dependent [Deltaproteobacteria bacterium RIFCSPLOWO2_02_FULL_44_10]|nr:MAG: thymidylate synthase, flavin-dependent [Deltaproteobacteria bacterium RIFCSPHIGHO2_02_FULL_44_16]OGQ47372.1 MAG: thymidylate synthase, flavin-dependent [Deltaproteobacteria bacterium RIFCSPLOWO2_02_FULL_44_10]